MTTDLRVRDGAFRLHDFRQVFAAAAVSRLGTQIGGLAIPLVAVEALHATPGQVGLLGVLGTVAFLLIGLPAGAWVDRARRRDVMVAADLARAALMGWVPVAWALGCLSEIQLYAVVLLTGVCTVFFDVAAQSLLPQIVTHARLTAANTALVGLDAVAEVSGLGAGGYAVQLLTAPAAVAADGVSFLLSAFCVLRVRHREPRAVRAVGTRLGPEIRAGVRFVAGHPLLRAIAVKGALSNLSIQLSVTMLPLLFVRELRLPVGMLGLYLAVGGVGVFAGARCAGPLARRLGEGRAPWIAGAAVSPASLLLPLIGRGPWLWVAAAGWLVTTAGVGLDNVVLIGLRQRITPGHLLGRTNATMRVLLTGALAVGSGLAGIIGETAGVHAVLWTGAAGLAVAWLPLFLSPMRHLRGLPE